MKRLGILLALLVGLAILTWRLTRFGSEASPVAIETRERIATRGDAAVVPVPDAQAVLEERRAAEDGASATAPIVEAAPLALSVRDPLGAPVAGALVVLFRGETVLGNARMDDAGNAHVPAPGGDGEYVLFADGWEFSRGAIDLSAGSRTLSLVEGATVAGRVLVDGAAPRAPIELVWSTSPNVPTGLGWHELPLDIRRIILGHRGRGSEITAKTSMGGGFAFRGLVADVQGSLRWTGPYVPEGLPAASFGPGVRQHDVAAPSSDLILRLEAALEARARFVSPTGAPIERAYAVLDLAESRGPTRSAMSDEQGRVSFLLPRDVSGPVHLTAGRTNVSPTQSFVAQRPADSGLIWDLGELVLPPTRRILLHVCDSAGLPVHEARAAAWRPESKELGARTTTKGSFSLDVPEGPSRIRVQAFGFLGRLIDVPADEDEITATLERACTLEVQLPEGLSGTRGLALELECEGPMFVEAPECPELHLRTRGAVLSIEGSGGRTRARFDGSAGLHWWVAALVPGTALRARVSSRSRLLCEATIAPLAAGEQRVLELPAFEHAWSEFVLRVERPNGEPLGGANVLRVQEGRPAVKPEALCGTNAAGECRLQIDEIPAAFLIRHALFVPRLVSFDSIPTEPLVVRMEEGRTVEIEVVRPDGTPSEEVTSVTHESQLCGYKRAEALGAGRFRLTGLAPDPATICLRLPRGDVLRVHDASIPYLRVIVGGPGRITARIPEPSSPREIRWTVAVAERGSRTPFVRVGLATGEGGWLAAEFGDLAPGEYDAWIEQASETEFDRWTPVPPVRPFAITEQEPHASIDFEPLR